MEKVRRLLHILRQHSYKEDLYIRQGDFQAHIHRSCIFCPRQEKYIKNWLVGGYKSRYSSNYCGHNDF